MHVWKRSLRSCFLSAPVLAAMLSAVQPPRAQAALFDVNIFRYNQNQFTGGFGLFGLAGIGPFMPGFGFVGGFPGGLGLLGMGIPMFGLPGMGSFAAYGFAGGMWGVGFPGGCVGGMPFLGFGGGNLGFPYAGYATPVNTLPLITFPAANYFNSVPPVTFPMGFSPYAAAPLPAFNALTSMTWPASFSPFGPMPLGFPGVYGNYPLPGFGLQPVTGFGYPYSSAGAPYYYGGVPFRPY